MSSSDYKGSYRKMEFSACARDTLSRIETLIVNRSKPEIVMELISEYIFCEKSKDAIDSRSSRISSQQASLSLIKEFQLVVVLCEYFQCPGPEATRNAVFLSLFGGSNSSSRTSVLVKLISTSVSGLIAPLLCAVGTWMQQLGCTSIQSLELAQSLVKDFVIFSKKPSEQLKSLPMIAPRFAANLMTAVADLYLTEIQSPTALPPDMLLDIFTEWVSDNPSLCLASQLTPMSLPTGAIAMPVVTPLAGLIRWCVLAPLCGSSNSTYSKLHLAILQSLIQTPPPMGPPTAINAQHLCLTVNALHSKCEMLEKENINPENDENVQLSLERFAQAIQVALASRCVYGSIAQLFSRLESLPQNTLLQMVVKANRIA